MEAAVERFGRVDVLVNNAAVIRTHPLAEFSVEEFDWHIATNVRAPYFLIQAALPALRAADNASVVNISSSSATIVRPTQSVYGMTKAALEYLTKSLAAELASDGIASTASLPDRSTHRFTKPGRRREAAHEWMMPQIPLARMGLPDEIATWVWRLSDENASWVTGVILPVDGGQALDFQ